MGKKQTLINLGCGYIGHPDWINVDFGILAIINKFPVLKKIVFGLKLAPSEYNKKWPPNLKLVNLIKEFPFQEDSIDYIFSAHFFEHLKKHEALKLLRSCYKGLKKDGTIRIVVPDLDIITNDYINGKDKLKNVEVLNNHFQGVLRQEFEAPSLHLKILSKFARGHNWLYNYEYMKKTLELAGFKASNIKKCEYQIGKVPNLNFLDNHPDHSLYVEATK